MATNNATNNFSSSPLTTLGDLYGFGSSPTRIPVGLNLQMVQADSSNANGISYQYPAPIPSPITYLAWDFTNSSSNSEGSFTKANSGTGSASLGGDTSVFTTGAHQGILTLTTGTTNTGSASARQNTTSTLFFGNATNTLEILINLSALSNSTDRYTLVLGWNTINATLPASDTDVCELTYTDNANSGNWILNARSAGGTLNATNGSSGPSASTWYRIQLVAINNSSVQAFVNGVSIGTLTATFGSAANPTSWNVSIIKSAGTTSVSCYVDYVKWSCIYNTPR